MSHRCSSGNCAICTKKLRSDPDEVVSATTARTYHTDSNLNCDNCGIYKITCPCQSMYTGKTTTSFGHRFGEHFRNTSSINDHLKTCAIGGNKELYNIQFLENVYTRGKHTLSERESLWNKRLGGIINVQKTLKS